MFHRRHGYGRWLDVLEDAQLSLQPVIRAELLLRKVDDGSSFAQNGDAHHSSNDVENGSGKGMRFQITTFSNRSKTAVDYEVRMLYSWSF